MYKQSIYILNNPYRETFKNTSGDFGSDIIGWDPNASLHTLLFPLHLYSILTPQAAAVFPKNRKAIVQQTVSRIFFVVFFLRKLVKYMSSGAFGQPRAFLRLNKPMIETLRQGAIRRLEI